MEKLTPTQERLLEAVDEELVKVEARLAKVEPIIRERDRLRAVRRTLLAERSTTSGAGNSRTGLSMEEMVNFLRKEGASSVPDISEGLHVPQTAVRSHLNRHKGVRYEKDSDNDWDLIEGGEDE